MTYIYKLNIAGKSYVGSTGNIKDRMAKHKNTCNNPNSNYYNGKLYKFIRENGGWGNVEVHILQECNKDVKQIVEDFYIKHYNCVLNCIGAIFDVENYKEYQKEYRKNNKEKNKERKKEWYEKNKEKLNEKCNCSCGGKYIKRDKARHLKTKKHQNYLDSLSSSASDSSSFHSAGLK